jgi:hypothetical protein
MSRHRLLWNYFSLPALVTHSGLPLVHPLRHPEGYVHPKKDIEAFWMRAVADNRFEGLNHLGLETALLHPRQVSRMLKASPLVSSVDLSHCVGVTDELLDAILECPSANPIGVTTHAGFNLATAGTQKLQTLKLNFSVQFTPEKFSTFMDQVHWLKHLELSGCSSVTCYFFQDCLQKLPSLTVLRARASTIGAMSFVAVAEKSLALQVLDISGGMLVDDECLGQVGRTCGSLTELYVSSCARLTDVGLAAFRRNRGEDRSATNAMVAVAVDGCNLLSDSGIAQFLSAFPFLRVVAVDRTKSAQMTLRECLTGIPVRSSSPSTAVNSKKRTPLRKLSVANCLHLKKDVFLDPDLRRLVQLNKSILSVNDRKFLEVK